MRLYDAVTAALATDVSLQAACDHASCAEFAYPLYHQLVLAGT